MTAPRPVGSSAAREAASPVPPADGDGLELGAGCDMLAAINERHDRLFPSPAERERRALAAELEALRTTPSFAHPVPLTAELLAAHGGTLPDGTVVALNDGVLRTIRRGRVYDGDVIVGSSIAPWIAYSDARIVHLGAES